MPLRRIMHPQLLVLQVWHDYCNVPSIVNLNQFHYFVKGWQSAESADAPDDVMSRLPLLNNFSAHGHHQVTEQSDTLPATCTCTKDQVIHVYRAFRQNGVSPLAPKEGRSVNGSPHHSTGEKTKVLLYSQDEAHAY